MKDYFTLPQRGGKMDPDELEQWLAAFHSDDNRSHMVFPGMLYIDFPTETSKTTSA